MKSVVILVTVLVFITFTSSTKITTKNGRRYAPEEEKVTDRHYMFIRSDDGKYNLVNLKQKPKNFEVLPSDVTFYLYTKDNPDDGEVIRSSNLDDLLNSTYFDPNRKNVFTSPGWRGSVTSDIHWKIRRALIEIGSDVNMFAIDWSGPANLFYTFSVLAVPIVGEISGNFINQMMTHYNLNPSDFVLIGHSLGGNVVGCIGAAVDGLVEYIVALDPAYPLFSLDNPDTRIDETDAKMVQVVHSNGGFQGFSSSVGHSDYFPNGGRKQPGCGLDFTGSCSHQRAEDYYMESLVTAGFTSLKCESFENYQNGLCEGNEKSFLGRWDIDTEAYGDYYLDTYGSSPFSKG